jgi:helicase associated protein
MKLMHKDRWEQGFAALCKFRRPKDHCSPPQRYVESNYNLGSWVVTQRTRKRDLSVERKERLDRIGFVWNWRDFAWERGFAALLKFKRREGHCRVHGLHREGGLQHSAEKRT